MTLWAPGNLIFLQQTSAIRESISTLISLVLTAWSFSQIQNHLEKREEVTILKIDTIPWNVVSQKFCCASPLRRYMINSPLSEPWCWTSDSVVHGSILAPEFLTLARWYWGTRRFESPCPEFCNVDAGSSFTICTGSEINRCPLSSHFWTKHPLTC